MGGGGDHHRHRVGDDGDVQPVAHGRVVLVAKGALSAQALAKLQRDVEPRHGECVDGPRAPRCAWPR
jgi:hypothetical protein